MPRVIMPLAGLSAAAALIGVAGCGSRAPAVTPQQQQDAGLIAYTEFAVSGEGLEPSLFTIRSDGTQRRRLVKYAWMPAWSRDGRLAFVDSGESIAVARADGTPTRTVTIKSHPGFCRQPVWSPNGDRIACAAEWDDGGPGAHDQHTALFTVALGSGRERQYVTDISRPDSFLAWSPDGRTLAFDHGSSPGVSLLDLRTARTRPLVADGSTPAWSPGGGRIAFSTGNTIATVNPDGSRRRTLVRVRPPERLADPTWSPDGKRLAYSHFNQLWQDTARGVFIVDADGANRRLLVRRGFDPDWHPR